MEAKEEGVLVGKVDVYNGVIVDAEKLPSDLVVFGESLQSKYCLPLNLPHSERVRSQESLRTWRKEGRRGVWLRLPLDKSHLISVAVEVCSL